MSIPPSICLMCRARSSLSLYNSAQLLSSQQHVRFASNFRQKRRPARMALSDRVASPSKPAPRARTPKSSRNSPWAGTNMKVAHMTREPNARSQSEVRRSAKGTQRLPGSKMAKEGEGKKEKLFHALKMQRRLSEITYGQRNAVKKKIADVDRFEQFDLLPQVAEAMRSDVFRSLDVLSPSPIQRLAIPALLGRKSGRQRLRPRPGGVEQFLLAAETGSGKTLAYMLPLVDAMKRAEAEDSQKNEEEQQVVAKKLAEDPTYAEPPAVDTRTSSSQARPRAIVLVPTAELVAQVTAVAKRLSHIAKFRSAAISSSFTSTVIKNRLFSESGIDLIVATPQLLASICEAEPNLLSRVTNIVVDEADSLLDRSFSPSTTSIIDRSASSLRQLVFCSATIPRSLDNYLRQRFPDLTRLTTPNLHAVPRRVQLGTIDVEKDPYRGNRNLACADAIWTIGKDGAAAETLPDLPEADADSFVLKRILVFVNERETAGEVAGYLRSKGIDASELTRDTSEQRQAELLAAFTTQPTTKPEPSKRQEMQPDVVEFKTANKMPAPSRTLPNTKVLVTTDIGSRGIDTLAVRNVILYDVPHTTIDFLHRLGRVGRMNRRGRGIVLIGRKDRRDVVKEVKDAMFRGQALI